MSLSINTVYPLSNGVMLPILGLGVWQMENYDELFTAVKGAIDAGYRCIDTASRYGNEDLVGRALKECGVERKDIFLITKMANNDQQLGRDVMLKGFESSLEKLGTDYVDLYLMHWPINEEKKYLEAWKVIVDIYNSGRARAIGVSNCHIHHIEEMAESTGVMPMVNQVECHPWLSQKAMRDYCSQKGIQFQSYCPLMHGLVMNIPELVEIGKKYNKSAAQITLRWHLQNGAAIIPKSSNPKRIAENRDLFDFELTDDEMLTIDNLNRNERFFPDPDVLGPRRTSKFA